MAALDTINLNHFVLIEQKHLYGSLKAAFKLAGRSIVVGHKVFLKKQFIPLSAVSLL